ncbi:hypothetical protein [Haliscomenobacter sp.]|uniref:hypothetical protein n=1 Tax=Haliscomenobacter sp. TaxID=2717303 RepID=UPI0035948814
MRNYLNIKFIFIELIMMACALSCAQFSANKERLITVKNDFPEVKKWLQREYDADLQFASSSDTSILLNLTFDKNNQGKIKTTYTIARDTSFIIKSIFYQINLQKNEDRRELIVNGLIESIKACGINIDNFAWLSFIHEITIEPALVEQLPVEESYDVQNLQIVSIGEKSVIKFAYIRGRISEYSIDVFYDTDRKFLKEEKIYSYDHKKNIYALKMIKTAVDTN